MSFFPDKLKKSFSFLLCLVLIVAAATSAVYANSAEPPAMTVIVEFPPDDLSLYMQLPDGSTKEAVALQKEKKAWEGYYRFFYGMAPLDKHDINWSQLDNITLVAESREKSFECLVATDAFSSYNNLITLNFKNESIVMGTKPMRQAILVSMRVILTLLIEGLIFLALGYRKKSSWIIFIIVNLITQLCLNLTINGPMIGSYWIYTFIFGELVIFTIETIVFAFTLREHKWYRAIICALTANTASLVLGGIILSYLPI